MQANWVTASEADQREFIVGMFVIAFGEEAVQQAMGSTGGGGGAAGGGACSDIDSCMSAYADPETLNDSMNAQSCWAAAGCTDYDAGSNDFFYEEPIIDVPLD